MTNTSISPAAECKLKNRVGVGFAVRNSFTLAYRAVLKMLHNPGTLADVAIMPIMFTLLFAFLFGGAISGSVASYLPTIVPGILLLTAIMSCASAGTQLREDMDKGITNRFKSLPIARIAPLAGILITDLIRFTLTGIITFAISEIIGYRPEAGIAAIIFCILLMDLIAWCLAWVFAFIGISVKSAASVFSISQLVTFPLMFLSNAFVPADTLPSWLQFFVVHINPLSRVVTAAREMLTYGTIGTDFWLSLFGAFVILVVFIPLTLGIYKRKA